MPGQDHHGGRFARTIRPQQAENLPRTDLKAQVMQGDEIPVVYGGPAVRLVAAEALLGLGAERGGRLHGPRGPPQERGGERDGEQETHG